VAYEKIFQPIQPFFFSSNPFQLGSSAMAAVGDILNEFFSPRSKTRLWVMPENDNYTRKVRKWQPVVVAVNSARIHLSKNSSIWQASYVSQPSWRPTMSDGPKPGAYRVFVPSPKGTDPDTCTKAFVIYAGSVVAGVAVEGPYYLTGLAPTIQTDDLYFGSIGSFNIYATVDAINCAAKTATMNFWMYNAMSRTSFGQYAKLFPLSGMNKQYMWWNWVETVEWSSGIRTVPRAGGSW
jgi:hypothetical protein